MTNSYAHVKLIIFSPILVSNLTIMIANKVEHTKNAITWWFLIMFLYFYFVSVDFCLITSGALV